MNINSLGDDESRNNYRNALVEYFKPHLDHLCEDCKERFEKNPLRILDCKVDGDKDIMKNAPTTIEYLNEESKKRFVLLQEYLNELGIDYEVDPKIVRGLDYYNHTVFEIEAKVKGFGSNNVLGGGGRYNELVSTLGGPKTSAVGFASGLDRLMTALELEDVKLPINNDVDVFVMYVSDTEKKYALSLIQELRMNGFRIDCEYSSRSLKGQFKKADRLNAKYLIILNDEDLKNDEVTVKNNKTKEEDKVGIDYLIYYLDEQLVDEEFIDDYDEECDHEDCDCGHHHN